MGATTSTAAGSTRTGGRRTAATDTPQATTPTASVPVIVGSLTIAGRVEVVDNGSVRSTPVVKSEVFEPDGHGLFLVEQLADNWGYTRDTVGTTVWFRLTC